MYLPGTMAIIVGLVLINRIRNSPKQLGLPTIEKYRNDYPEDAEKGEVEKEKNLSSKEILFEHILKNKFILDFGDLFLFCVYCPNIDLRLGSALSDGGKRLHSDGCWVLCFLV